MGLKGFSRIKNWLGLDNFTFTDINAEFNNLFTGVGAQTVSGASGDPATLASMRLTEDPGNVGTETLPVTVQDEVRQIRFQLDQIIGGTYWYDDPPASLTTLNTTIEGLNPTPANRILSGRVTSFNQPAFLVPDGAIAQVSLLATATDLQTYINSLPVTFSADIALPGLTLAPSSQNTALVNDTQLSGQQSSEVQGERDTIIQIDAVGTNISSKDGQYACFKKGSEVFYGQIVHDTSTLSIAFSAQTPTVAGAGAIHGLNTGDQITFTGGSLPAEVVAGTVYYVVAGDTGSFYLSATLNGSLIGSTAGGSGTGTPLKNSCIKKCFRGWFFDENDDALARAALSDNDTITLLQVTYIFATNNSGTPGLALTYTRPSVSAIQPSTPAIGDYWLDLTVNHWKVYNGSSFTSTDAVMLGICAQSTAATIAARSVDFNNAFSALNTIDVEWQDSAEIVAKTLFNKISVYGRARQYDYDRLYWNTVDNLDAGVSLAANTTYYAYVTDSGKQFISDQAPTDRTPDLLGLYHPNKPWRCVGTFDTDGSMDIPSNVVSSDVFPATVEEERTISSATCTGYTNTTSSPTQVTNMDSTIFTKHEGPVHLSLGWVDDGSVDVGQIQAVEAAGAQVSVNWRILRNSVVIAVFQLQSSHSGSTAVILNLPNWEYTDFEPAGSNGQYRYQIQAYVSSGDQIAIANWKLILREI